MVDRHEQDMKHANAYRSLALQAALGGLVMYLAMFTMIDGLDSFYNNVNMLYMTLMMVAPMVMLMILGMRRMFPSTARNAAWIGGSVLVFMTSYAHVRSQATIDDRAFLRSMIPHHSGAILMCGRASLSDSEVRALCRNVIDSQRREIEQMKRILERL